MEIRSSVSTQGAYHWTRAGADCSAPCSENHCWVGTGEVQGHCWVALREVPVACTRLLGVLFCLCCRRWDPDPSPPPLNAAQLRLKLSESLGVGGGGGGKGVGRKEEILEARKDMLPVGPVFHPRSRKRERVRKQDCAWALD